MSHWIPIICGATLLALGIWLYGYGVWRWAKTGSVIEGAVEIWAGCVFMLPGGLVLILAWAPL